MQRAVWSRIKEHLKSISDDIYDSINMPATSKEIDILEKVVEVKLPQSFCDYLLTLNGQINTDENSRNRNDEIPLLGYNTFLSTIGIIETWNMMNELFEDMTEPIDWVAEKEIKPLVWSKGWIPFAEYEGNCIILDCSPGKNGTYGQVFIRPNVMDFEGILAESFEKFSNELLRRLSEKEFEIGEFGTIDFNDYYI